MAFSFRHLITGFACVAALFDAHAEAASPPAKEVSVRFTVFALGGTEGVAYRPRAGKPPQTLKFYSAYRSSEYNYRSAERLVFFDAKITDGAAAPVAVYDIPEGAKALLLLFSPKPSMTVSGLRYDVHGIDDTVDTMPAGYFRTINLSGREYVGQYGGTHIEIPEGPGAIHSAKGRVALRFAAQVEGNWMPTGKYEFTMTARDRVTLILYPPASPTAVYPIVRRLTDTTPVRAENSELVASTPGGG